MKKISLIFLIATLFFGAFSYYFMYHADGGADGLIGFIPLVLFGVLFICSLLAFLMSFLLRKGQSKTTRNRVLVAIIGLPIFGILSVTVVFSYFNYDYQSQWEDSIKQEKAVLQTIEFHDKDFGVSFQHVSGRVTTHENTMPIPTPITPRIENGMLIVPSDDESYLSPDILLKIEIDAKSNLDTYFEDLKRKLVLDNIDIEQQGVGDFEKLAEDVKLWKIGSNFEDREKVAHHFLSERDDAPDMIYFLQTPKKPKVIWVLIISGTNYSAAANVEKMSTSNYKDGNLWFHTLAYID